MQGFSRDGRGGQGSSPSLAHCPRSARFPDSHLQGQDAVVPHKRLAVTTSFKSLSGLPATIKGHVCKREEGGGGKYSWTEGGVSPSPSYRRGACVSTRSIEATGLQFTRCVRPGRTKQAVPGSSDGDGLLELWPKRARSGFSVEPLNEAQPQPESRCSRGLSRACGENY